MIYEPGTIPFRSPDDPRHRSLCRRFLSLIAILVLLTPSTIFAQTQPVPNEPREQETRAALQEAVKEGTQGPATIPLLDQGRLHLPPAMIFIPPAVASRVLRAWGNRIDVDPTGMVMGLRREDGWAAIIRFVKEGYIKDDDAKDWKADELLANIRAFTEETNKDRVNRGFPELEVVGWIAAPHYDPVTHRLIFSLAKRVKNSPAEAVQPINYVTYALGRDGYFSVDMLTNQARVAHDQIAAAAILSGLEYDDGRRYQDFNASTDHVAAYGLAALVGVVAAKKLGLLALAGVFAVKFAKLGAIALAGLVALAAKLLRRKAN